MARRFFSGATLEQAVLAAARHHGIEPERVAYEQRERQHGVLNLRRKVVIEVAPEAAVLPEGQEVPWQPKLAGVSNPAAGAKPVRPAAPGSRTATDGAAARAGRTGTDAHAALGADREGERGARPQADAVAGGERRVGAPAWADAGGGEDAAVESSGDREVVAGRDDRDRSGEDIAGDRDPLGPRVSESRVSEPRVSEPRVSRAGGEWRLDHAPAERGDGGHPEGGAWRPAGQDRVPPVVNAEPLMADPLDAADTALGEIADFLLFDMQWEIQQEADESLSVDLGGDDREQIVANDAQVMRAIEHLLPRLIRGKAGQPFLVRVDCDGFLAEHEARMQVFAERVAEEVRRAGRSRLLDPMAPADRRLVHVALASDPTVDTESEGEGFTKRVRISPV